MSNSIFQQLNTKEDLLAFIQLKPKLSENISTFNSKEFKPESEKFIFKLATEICAIANSGGGLIFLGISASRRILKELTPLNSENFPPLLQSLISTTIKPYVKFETKRISLHDRESVFIIHIEKQPSIPFMAPDNRFYKKQEHNTIILSESELRSLYLMGSMPKVDFFAIQNTNGVPSLENGKFKIVNFYPRFLIKNTGNEIENTYKIELHVPTAINNQNFDVLQRHFSRMEDHNTVYSISNRNPLFQNEIATVIDANFMITPDNFNLFREHDIIIKIFYSKGMNENRVNLLTTFLYKGNMLQAEDFSAPQGLHDATIISLTD